MSDFIILMKSELVVTTIIFLLLFVKIGKGMRNEKLLPLIQVLLLINVLFSFVFNKEGSLFDGMFSTTSLIAFQKSILSLAVYLISLLCSVWLKRSEHLPEFFMLMLSALLGMFFMISSGNLLIFYLSLELSTIPVAAMANFDLQKRASSEGAMKMILSSAFSSGILLFGISLIYGTTGTILFSEIPGQLDGSPIQILAFVFLFTAFAFKLSVVPFHLWTADVYEGAPIATTSFLSVVSKGAVAFIFITALYKVFQPLEETWYLMLVILSIATMVIGNLFALRQKNIKRFLAFSSIAQVGFILVGISAGNEIGISSVVFFILVYVFSNLAAFGVADVISAASGKESIDDYKGLYKTNPFLSWIMTLALFSLAGIPPTAGFFGKLFLISAGAAKANYIYIIIVALNMIVSLYYYLIVVRAIFIDKNEQPIDKIAISKTVKLALIICGAGIILLGLLSWIYEHIQSLTV
ncbi:MAG TPA: NADH-quinone oxidoreductase subunit N [Chitinophagaceae bacterium]|nr:NADH-quinone oxidoreductase subunit N [Chitinophagales bacterium]HPG12070.1 NADH-quinone oxidoreductase subunit N [Chitinophagaceae bacterium]